MPHSELVELIRSTLAELDVEVEVQPAPEPLTGEHVVAAMPSDSSDEPWIINFTPYPGLEEDVEGADVVQVMCILPFVARMTDFPEIGRLLLNINNKTTIGAFGLREADGVLFYRNTLLLPHHSEGNVSIIENGMLLAGFLIEHFADAIEMVAVGEGSLEDARDVCPDLDEFAK